jgi:ADP-dependent NAD(P)H-hydrate dehydratase / NAD(P)H-hydrate epimerase
MRPVVSVAEMQAIDAAADTPTEVLVARAGAAVARAVLRRLGGSYGRRAVVVAGKGHNGDDGRVAAARLTRQGVRTVVIDAATRDGPPPGLPACDVVVDAAYGTGFRGDYRAPDPLGAPVVAVDIPSGVHGDTGAAGQSAVRAELTVTFAALKPGLLVGDGPTRSGRVEVADIGLPVDQATSFVVDDTDVVRCRGERPRDAHKWQSAVYVVAGSPGMLGAAAMASRGAARAGAGMVRLGVPGASADELPVSEVVSQALGAADFEDEVLATLERCRALVVGPGLGRSEQVEGSVRRLLARAGDLPAVVDADALSALGTVERAATVVAERSKTTPSPAPMVLTPHAGEYRALAGRPVGDDPLEASRDLARRSGCVVLLKGPTTVVAEPAGRAFLATAGSPRLATAGTGDVLSGVIGAFLARGVGVVGEETPGRPEAGALAGALAAHVHGRAASLGYPDGLLAGDLPDLVAAWLSAQGAAGRGGGF